MSALSALAFAAALLLPAAAAGQSAPQPAAAPIYTHSSGEFALMPPPGSRVAERQGALAITIMAPQGYAISVQGGDAHPEIALAERMAEFEAQNLGEGKRWSRKLGGRETQVNGYPAFEALYVSATEAARATILRAGAREFVFIYLTPPKAYADHLGQYFAVMASFRPGANAPSPASAQDPAHATPTPRPAAPETGRVMMFADAAFGLTARYPGNWTAERPTPQSVIFSGPEGSDAYYATVRLDRVAVPPHGDPGQSLTDVLADLRRQINQGTRNPVFMVDRPHVHRGANGLTLTGHEVVAAFTYRNQRFRRWLVVLPRPALPEAYVWTFTAPDVTFDRYLRVAQEIIDSMNVSAPETAATKF